jgi:hypothetical protein
VTGPPLPLAGEGWGEGELPSRVATSSIIAVQFV